MLFVPWKQGVALTVRMLSLPPRSLGFRCEDMGPLGLFSVHRHPVSSLELLPGSSYGRCPTEERATSQHVPRPTCLLRVPLPCSQPRWSLPGQLSCLPHASAAPRTGPCKDPAGQGASKPGSSWDAQGTGGRWVVLPWGPHTSVHVCVGGADWGSEDRELEERRPGTQESHQMSFNPAASHQVHKLVDSVSSPMSTHHSYSVLGSRGLAGPLWSLSRTHWLLLHREAL